VAAGEPGAIEGELLVGAGARITVDARAEGKDIGRELREAQARVA
jgi:hypothetical protein